MTIPVEEAIDAMTERKLAAMGLPGVEEQKRRFEAGQPVPTIVPSDPDTARAMLLGFDVDPEDMEKASDQALAGLMIPMMVALTQGVPADGILRSMWLDGFLAGCMHGELRAQRAPRPKVPKLILQAADSWLGFVRHGIRVGAYGKDGSKGVARAEEQERELDAALREARG